MTVTSMDFASHQIHVTANVNGKETSANKVIMQFIITGNILAVCFIITDSK